MILDKNLLNTLSNSSADYVQTNDEISSVMLCWGFDNGAVEYNLRSSHAFYYVDGELIHDDYKLLHKVNKGRVKEELNNAIRVNGRMVKGK